MSQRATRVAVVGCALAWMLGACGSMPSAPRPAWTDAATLDEPAATVYVGQAQREGRDARAQAVRAAQDDALAAFARSLGATVDSASGVEERHDAQGNHLRAWLKDAVRARRIEVKDFDVLPDHVEEGAGEAQAWARVRIPGAERERLRRRLDNRAALVLTCAGLAPAWACPPGTDARLRQLATERGLAATLAAPHAPSDLTALAREGYAWRVDVTLRQLDARHEDGTWYEYLALDWTQTATDDARATTLRAPPQGDLPYRKGGSYRGAQEAATKALDELILDLDIALQGWEGA